MPTTLSYRYCGDTSRIGGASCLAEQLVVRLWTADGFLVGGWLKFRLLGIPQCELLVIIIPYAGAASATATTIVVGGAFGFTDQLTHGVVYIVLIKPSTLQRGLFQQAVFSEIGRLISGPIGRFFLFHIVTPSFAAHFGRAARQG